MYYSIYNDRLGARPTLNHGNLRSSPRCHPPKKYGLNKALLTLSLNKAIFLGGVALGGPPEIPMIECNTNNPQDFAKMARCYSTSPANLKARAFERDHIASQARPTWRIIPFTKVVGPLPNGLSLHG